MLLKYKKNIFVFSIQNEILKEYMHLFSML